MMNGKRILAVVPARGGSKGVPMKNIRPVNGVPLLAMVAPVVKNVQQIDRTVVSTDNSEVARVAKEAGLEVPFVRPPEISGDRIGDWDVLIHALHTVEKVEGKTYDIILLLPPTSPLRTPDHVLRVLEKIVNENLDSVWTVTESDLKFHPLKALTITDGRMDYFDARGSQIIARQQLTPVYHRNGLAYAMTRSCLIDQKKIMGKKAGAIIVNETLVNIDTQEDFDRLEKILLDRRV